MVTITKVAKLQKTVVEELEDLGFSEFHTDTDGGYVHNQYRTVYWMVEAYIDEDAVTPELEQAVLDIVDGTAWECDFRWDTADRHDERGILCERHLQ